MPSIFLRLLFLTMMLAPMVSAQVEVSPYFASGAILQRDAPIPVWGTSPAGEQITVSLSGIAGVTVSADASGEWEAVLPSQPAGGPYTLTVQSSTTTSTSTDIWFGDVWIASGQSNMDWLVFQTENGPADAQASNDPLLRQFTVPKTQRTTPSTTLPTRAAWTSADVPSDTQYFMSVPFYAGRELRTELGVPIGIIAAGYGGARVEEWMSTQMLNGRGTAAPGRLSAAWNGMIHPLLRLPIKGVMFYQGESNATNRIDALAYGDLFRSMIVGWRTEFGIPDMPFLWVQLPNYGGPQTAATLTRPPANVNWPILRDQQSQALSLPFTGQVVSFDTGNPSSDGTVDIHPTRKEPVGQRMALKLREVAYGETLISEGATYASNQRRPDGAIVVDFENVGGGLANADGVLNGFSMRGANGQYEWADATLIGNQVVLTSPIVTDPVAIRYAWQTNPGNAGEAGTADLVTAEGFPTAPFEALVGAELAGTYSVFGPGADYATLADAIADLGLYGIRDAVRFELGAGTHPERLSLGSIVGASATTRVTFAAASGAAVTLAPTASGAGDNFVLRLTGAAHVTISGLTLEPGGTTYEDAIVLAGTLTDVTIQGNTLTADGTTGERHAISSATPLESTSLMIRDNTISGFSTGIALDGNALDMPTGTSVQGNQIASVRTGLRLDRYNAALVQANVIAASDSGMVLTNLAGETRVQGNVIAASLSGLFIADSDGAPGVQPLAANNMIRTRAGSGTALRVTLSDHWRIWHNTLSAGDGAGTVALRLDGGAGLSVQNNILSTRTSGLAMEITGAPLANFESDYNVLFTGGTTIGRVDLTDYATLPTFASAIDVMNGASVQSANSRRAPTVFADATVTNLRLAGESLGDPLLSVPQLAGLLTDIDGDARGSATYAGADEAGVAFFDRVVLHGPAGWRLLSLPYPDLGFGGSDPSNQGGAVTPGLLEPLYTAGYPGADIDEDGSGGYTNVFLFDETETSGVPNAEYSAPTSNLLPAGQGFWYYMFQDEDPFTNGEQGIFPKILPASGTPLATDYTFPVTYTRGGPIPGANLLGNPYAEGLNWDAPGWTRSKVITTAYVYDPSLGAFGDYRQWTVGVGGTLTDGVIPVGHGFFTYATGSSAVLTAPASARTGFWEQGYSLDGPRTTTTTASAKSGQAPEALPHVRFEMTGEIGGRTHTAFAAIAISDDADYGFDARDAYALEPASGGDALRLAASLPDGGEGSPGLSVTTVPGEAQIGLLAEAFASGASAGVAAQMSWQPTRLDGWIATLEDRATGRFYSLSEAGEVSLDLGGRASSLMPFKTGSEASKSASSGLPGVHPLRLAATGGERFTVSLARAATGGDASGERTLALGAPTPNPTRGSLRVPVTLDASGDAEVAVYDALGRRVAVLSDGPLAAGAHDFSMDASSLAPGLYIVRLRASDRVLTRRFTVVR